MPEHLIQLRRAWDAHLRRGEAEEVRRVDLPTAWPADLPGPVRLARAFRRPPLDPGHESLALRLESVPGLRAVRLNDAQLPLPAAGALEYALADSLPPRNVLRLELDPAAAAVEPAWGKVALVIRSG